MRRFSVYPSDPLVLDGGLPPPTRPTPLNRLVWSAVRRAGMTHGWFTILTDRQICELDELHEVGRSALHDAFRAGELAGRYLRLKRWELRLWLEANGYGGLLGATILGRSAPRVIVDLELLRDAANAAPEVRQVATPIHFGGAPAVCGVSAEPAPAGAHDTPDAVPLACAHGSALGLREEKKDLPLTPSDGSGQHEAEQLVERWRRKGTLFKLSPDSGSIQIEGNRGLTECEVPKGRDLERLKRLKPHVIALLMRERASGKRGANAEHGPFLHRARTIVAGLERADTREAGIEELYKLLAGEFKAEGASTPHHWRRFFRWFAATATGRAVLIEKIESVKSRKPRGTDENFFSVILSNAFALGAQKPTPEPTRQSAPGVGPHRKPAALTNCTQSQFHDN